MRRGFLVLAVAFLPALSAQPASAAPEQNEARIVAAADAYVAMTSERPYRPAMTSDAAVAELEAAAGTHLDPTVVRALTNVLAGDGARLRARGSRDGDHRRRDDRRDEAA